MMWLELAYGNYGLLKKGRIEFRFFDSLNFWGTNGMLYEYLCVAFLRENYCLQIDLVDYRNKVLISKKEKGLTDEYKKLFPVCFFLPEINMNSDILTTKESYLRHACNEYHRLSQFILKNGMKLKKYVPGIFKEFLRVLAKEGGDKLIYHVNGLLENLRRYPGGLFEVSDELFLSEKDLI